MKRFYLLGLTLLSLFGIHSLAKAQGGSSPRTTSYPIHGYVIDAETKAPLDLVDIFVVGEGGRSTSNTDGSFTIYVENLTACRLRFMKEGYVMIDALPIGIDRSNFQQLIMLKKTNTQCVSGRIVDQDGKPIEGAEITVPGTKYRPSFSDKDGYFCAFTPDFTFISLDIRKDGYISPNTLNLGFTAAFAIAKNIVLERMSNTPPNGRHIQIFEKGAEPGTIRGPIQGVASYVNKAPSSTGKYGISNPKGYLIVSADPGDKITLIKEGYVTISDVSMPDKSLWIVEMSTEPWYEAQQFKTTDCLARNLIARIYMECKTPLKPGAHNPRLEALLDTFEMVFKTVAGYGNFQNDSLERIRKLQYFDPKGPFRKLMDYKRNNLAGAAKWAQQRANRDKLVGDYENEIKVLAEIKKKIELRQTDPSIYSKLPNLLRKAQESCRQMIFLCIRLRDDVGLDIGDIIDQNLAGFNDTMDKATSIFKNELKDQPKLASEIEQEIETLRNATKGLQVYGKDK